MTTIARNLQVWLDGSQADAEQLLQLVQAEMFAAGPFVGQSSLTAR